MKHELIKLWGEYKKSVPQHMLVGLAKEPIPLQKNYSFPDFMDWLSKEEEKRYQTAPLIAMEIKEDARMLPRQWKMVGKKGEVHSSGTGEESWEDRFDEKFEDQITKAFKAIAPASHSYNAVKYFILEEIKKAYFKGHSDGFDGHYDNMPE